MGKLIALKCLFFTIICILVSHASAQDRKTILAYGDSLFSDDYVYDGESFPEQLDVKLKELGFYGDVIGVGNNGFTSSEGLRALERTLEKYPDVDLVILEFGGNDLLRNMPSEVTFSNMEKMINILKQHDIPIYIAGLILPYDGFQGFSNRLDYVYSDLSKKYDLPLDPYFLEGVFGAPDLNNRDGIHPNKLGNWIIANRLAPKILEVITGIDPDSKIQTLLTNIDSLQSEVAEQAEEEEESEAQTSTMIKDGETNILVFGDSLVAGYGLAPEESFPAQLELKLRQMNPNITVHNAGVSGDTSSGGMARLEWVLSSYVDLDLVIILFGGNDALRGLHPDMTRRNMDKMVSILKDKNIPTLVAGMVAPPNLGQVYGDRFNSVYPEVANKYDVALYPFYLDGVAGILELNQSDRIHPNLDGVKYIVDRISPLVFETAAK